MTAVALQSGEHNEAGSLDRLQRALIDGYQRGFPLTERPYATIAEALGVNEAAVIEALADLRARGVLGRIGAAIGNGGGRRIAVARQIADPDDFNV